MPGAAQPMHGYGRLIQEINKLLPIVDAIPSAISSVASCRIEAGHSRNGGVKPFPKLASQCQYR
jgi:hypothetical protein